MSKDDAAIRRALGALESAADEPEHPGYEVLEAYVEGRLSLDERARIDRLVAESSVIAEDLADLQAVHDQLAARPAPQWTFRWGQIAGAAALVATLLVVVWLVRLPVIVDPGPEPTLTDAQRSLIDRTVAAGAITVPLAVANMMPRSGTLLGPAPLQPALSLLAPIGSAVRSARPTFTWTDARADDYTVAIFDEQFKEVARSPRVRVAVWEPSADLPRGVGLVWQVTAHYAAADRTMPQPPQPEARFMVIDEATAARVRAFESGAFNDPLALGILLADAGLVADARARLAQAAQEPSTAEVAKRLLASLDAYGTPTTTKPAQ